MASGSPVEKMIAEIWAEVLDLKTIGVHDNFFDIGGHSLLAVRIVSRIRASLGVDLSILSIFEKSTVAELAAHIDLLSWVGQPHANPPEDAGVRSGEIR